METSIQRTEAALQDALSNPAYRVIALTGRWGTGKTFLWRNLAKKSEDIIEISAFGAKNIDDINKRLLQASSLLGADKTATLTQTFKPLADVAQKFTGWNIGDTILLALPSSLKGKTIVIDDVERKNRSFEVGDLLGLVNEYTQKHEARFVLILNTDNLEDRDLWQSLHEKVIDKEIALNPLPENSFSIATEGCADPFLKIAKEEFITHRIQNIRIIQKTLQAIREIFSRQKPLQESLYERMIPPLVFLGICHFRGFNSKLDLDYVANYVFKQQKTADNQEWNGIINNAGIRPEKLTEIAIDYLKLGVTAHEELALFLKPLRFSTDRYIFNNSIDEFLEDIYWDPTQAPHEVRGFAEFLAPKVYDLEYSQLLTVYNALCQHDYGEVGEELLDLWLKHAKEDAEIYQKLEYLYSQGAPKKLLDFKDTLTPPLERTATLKEAIENSLLKGQPTQKEINTLLNITTTEYETMLSSLTKDELRRIVEFHFRIGAERDASHWQSAYRHFILACRNISGTVSGTKLGKILDRELTQRNI